MSSGSSGPMLSSVGNLPRKPISRLVHFDHDGGLDDFVALLLFLGHQASFRLLGVSVIPANSSSGGGVSATRKILRRFARTRVPVSEVTLTGQHSFPESWREDVFKVDGLPGLNLQQLVDDDTIAPEAPISGQDLLCQSLRSAEEPVTVIATGPLTSLAWVLDNHPELEPCVQEVLIMGGAIDVKGNVSPEHSEGSDGTAEWNFHWDPTAAKRVWDSSLPLVVTPLDSTDKVPVTNEVMLRLSQQQGYKASALVNEIWKMAGAVATEVSAPLFSWDLVTVAQLVRPELFATREVQCDIIAVGPSRGRVVKTAGPEGRDVTVIEVKDTSSFYDVILKDLRY